MRWLAFAISVPLAIAAGWFLSREADDPFRPRLAPLPVVKKRAATLRHDFGTILPGERTVLTHEFPLDLSADEKVALTVARPCCTRATAIQLSAATPLARVECRVVGGGDLAWTAHALFEDGGSTEFVVTARILPIIAWQHPERLKAGGRKREEAIVVEDEIVLHAAAADEPGAPKLTTPAGVAAEIGKPIVEPADAEGKFRRWRCPVKLSWSAGKKPGWQRAELTLALPSAKREEKLELSWEVVLSFAATPSVLRWDKSAASRRAVVATRDGQALGKVEVFPPAGFSATARGGATAAMVEVKPTGPIKPGLLGAVKVRTDLGELEIPMYSTEPSGGP